MIPVRPLPRAVDRDRFARVTREVVEGRCSAFIGAGLSQGAGFPGWKGLLEALASLAGLSIACERYESGPREMLAIAEECREALGRAEFEAALYDQFRDRGPGRERYRAVHADLLDIPFQGYLTTNFDLCLEAAAERQRCIEAVYVHPLLPVAELRSRSIFHVHGRVHDHEGASTTSSIVITAGDYEATYGTDTGPGQAQNLRLPRFLLAAFECQTMLFMGFGFSDPEIDQVLMQSIVQRRGLYEDLQRSGVGTLREARHYALLPTKRSEELTDADRAIVAQEDDEEKKLLSRQVEVIRYFEDNPYHSHLCDLVVALREGTVADLRQRPPLSSDRYLSS